MRNVSFLPVHEPNMTPQIPNHAAARETGLSHTAPTMDGPRSCHSISSLALVGAERADGGNQGPSINGGVADGKVRLVIEGAARRTAGRQGQADLCHRAAAFDQGHARQARSPASTVDVRRSAGRAEGIAADHHRRRRHQAGHRRSACRIGASARRPDGARTLILRPKKGRQAARRNSPSPSSPSAN